MRTVFTNAELPHLWAYARQAHGRNGTQSFYFYGDTIYSYGKHFPIARRLRHDLFAVTTASYSITTTGHKRLARAAIPSWARVLWVDNPKMPADAADRQRSEAIALRFIQSASKRRSAELRQHDLAEAMRTADDFNAYAEAVGSAERITMMSDGVMAMSVEQLRLFASEVDLKREVDERRREMEAAERLSTQIERWKRGDTSVSSHEIRNAPVCLRLRHYSAYLATKVVEEVDVETSRGARIPASEAVKLWPLIQRAVRGQYDYEPGTELGGYRLVRIRRNGSIVIGCHDIAYPEIERIALQLGLTTPATEKEPAHG